MAKSIALQPDRHNANKGTERGRYLVETSLREVGAGRSIVADRNGEVIAGNKTLEAWTEIGGEIEVVRTDGKKLIVVQRDDLDLSDDTGLARKLAYYDNRAGEVGLEWDAEQLLADLNGGLDLSAMFHDDELDALIAGMAEEQEQAANALSETEPEVTRADVPDALWPTDNDYGVPLLDLSLQAKAFDQPAAIWGATTRKTRMAGTWLFYTEDYRYEALWADPSPVLNTGARAAVEPNFSAYSNMPFAVALWQIYRKRWIARWWQQYGLPIWVDLNVAEVHAELNLCGVPDGWHAFATRGYTERLDATHREYELAQRKAGEQTPLFLVYGGGKAVKAECNRMGWLWMQEEMSKGKPGVSDG